MDYRREIDGLRAVAVLPVIFFHANFAGFAGGYVGVDVFFVISGYLISSIIFSELAQGQFSIIRFYERRARRILPALFAVSAICAPLALWLLYPKDLQQFAASLGSVALFWSNIFFWQNSSYFDTAAELKPMLHTWSLAVEEQYYLLFPLYFMACWRLGWRFLQLSLVAIAVFSLAFAHWAAFNMPTLNFYLLPSRIWELLVGGLVAAYLQRRAVEHGVFASVGSMAGLAMIIASIVLFDKNTPFPSLYTLLPTLGTALIILCAKPSNLVGKLLGLPVLVGVGLVSYSAYLWHQPLFAFARHASLEQPSTQLMASLVLLTLVLAYLSWRWIETPFRSKRFTRSKIFSGAGVGIAGMLAVAWLLPLLKAEFPLTPEQQRIYLADHADQATLEIQGRCFIDSGAQAQFDSRCGEVDKSQPSLLLWGDSHAAALAVGLRNLNSNMAQFTASRCPPILGRQFATARYCGQLNQFVFDQIGRQQPNYIVITAYWYSYGNRVDDFAQTLAQLRVQAPHSRIVVVGTVPLWPGELPVHLLKHKVDVNTLPKLPLALYPKLKLLDQKFAAIASAQQALFVSALDSFCDIQGRCDVALMRHGKLEITTFDYGHLSAGAAERLAAEVVQALPSD